MRIWFKRKPANRRLGREHVLEVKLRSSQVRAARIRMTAIALGALFSVAFGLYLVWRGGEAALNVLVYENHAFAIKDVDIQTDGVLAVDQLRRWAGVRPGQNLLALDLSRVKRNLELAPLIQSASIERILPRTLRIRVIERESIAQINVPRPGANGGLEMAAFQLDPEGYVLLPLTPRQRANDAAPTEQLPVIAGIGTGDAQTGHRIEAPRVQSALQLLVAFERSPMAGLTDLQRIDVSHPDVLVATTGQGSEITFRCLDLDQQLCRWHSIFETGQRLGKALATLDLAVSNNIPARWLEASAVPPATPRLPRTLHNKKRHV